jgi:hypothetical protein
MRSGTDGFNQGAALYWHKRRHCDECRSKPMIGTDLVESAEGVRQFTVLRWLLWTLIPALTVAALSWVTGSATRSAGNTNPASIMAGVAFLIMMVLLIPVVTTLQWLILRSAWPRLIWPAWLLVVFIAGLATAVAGPIVVMETHSWLYGAIPPILAIGLAASAALATASPKPLRLSVFAVLFVFFIGGGALMCGIDTSLIGGLLLDSSYYPPYSFTGHPSFLALLQSRTSSFILYHRDLVSLASGTAVSGLGLWLVSRWASKKNVMSEV